MPDWCTAWGAVDDLACAESEAAPDALAFANDVLFELSGRQYTGACEHTVRPTARSICQNSLNSPEFDAWSDPYYGVDLGIFPIRSITEVVIDGTVLSSGSYRVDQRRWLVRVDGQPWPSAQERMRANTETRTWEVSLIAGEDPPAGGVLALNQLTCELVAAAEGSEECRLPRRVTQVTRQGVTYLMTDLMEFLSAGRTGLYEVDLFLATHNPGGNRDRPFGLLPYDIPGSYDV